MKNDFDVFTISEDTLFFGEKIQIVFKGQELYIKNYSEEELEQLFGEETYKNKETYI